MTVHSCTCLLQSAVTYVAVCYRCNVAGCRLEPPHKHAVLQEGSEAVFVWHNYDKAGSGSGSGSSDSDSDRGNGGSSSSSWSSKIDHLNYDIALYLPHPGLSSMRDMLHSNR